MDILDRLEKQINQMIEDYENSKWLADTIKGAKNE